MFSVHRMPEEVYGLALGVSEDGESLAIFSAGAEALFVSGPDILHIRPPEGSNWVVAAGSAVSADGRHFVGGYGALSTSSPRSQLFYYSAETGLLVPEGVSPHEMSFYRLGDDGTIYGSYKAHPSASFHFFRWKPPGPLEPIEQLPPVPEFVPPQLTEEQANIYAPFRSRNHKWSGGHVVWKDATRPVSPVIVNAAGKQKLLDGVGTVSYVDDMGRVAVFRETRGTDDWGPWHLWIEGDKPRVLAELLVELGLTEAAEQEPEPQRLTGNGRHLVIQYRDQRLARLDIRWP